MKNLGGQYYNEMDPRPPLDTKVDRARRTNETVIGTRPEISYTACAKIRTPDRKPFSAVRILL